MDDSNATHPRSTRAALEALRRPVVLIAGGKAKGMDMRELFAAARRRARAVVAIGTSAPDLVAALAERMPVRRAGDMAEAVRAASGLARPGDAVLLSPGYASLDQYASFAERGARFQSAVRSLQEAP